MHVYDGRGSGQELASLDKIHSTKITFMKVHIYIYIPVYKLAQSVHHC